DLSLEVYTSSPYGYAVTSALVFGQEEVLLIDPQFLLSEANNVVMRIRASGKRLSLIYSTHAHPDHFLGVAAIKEAFPDARYVALPEVRERIATAWPARRNFWYPTYGDELPSETPIMPDALPASELVFEGHVFPITGEVVGLDGAGNSFVHIPELDAVVAGDIVFNSHLRPPADTAPLFETLARIAELDPAYVVAGHQAQGADSSATVLDFIPAYIEAFEQERARADSSEALIAAMKSRYPDLGREDALEQAANASFAE
ncbi:MAG TPA: MBL fold metallo-hydrolase, partial [Hyphomicrobiales bacterium]|nr:MBL fold metallo-hydrolase [Hyphomicrobiales bacterium]